MVNQVSPLIPFLVMFYRLGQTDCVPTFPPGQGGLISCLLSFLLLSLRISPCHEFVLKSKGSFSMLEMTNTSHVTKHIYLKVLL